MKQNIPGQTSSAGLFIPYPDAPGLKNKSHQGAAFVPALCQPCPKGTQQGMLMKQRKRCLKRTVRTGWEAVVFPAYLPSAGLPVALPVRS